MALPEAAERDAGVRLAVAPSPAMETAVRLSAGTVREHQEDDAGAFPELGLALVADGMGGGSTGDEASRIVVEDVPGCLRPWQGVPWRSGAAWGEHPLVTAIKLANFHVFDVGERIPMRRGMGSTVAALLEVDDGVLVAHVGDSRVYRLRAGRLEPLTRDHSLLNDYLDFVADGSAQPLTPEQVAELPRNVITRAIGAAVDVKVDVRHERREAGDLFLLCSDGLTEALDEPTIARLLNAGGELGAMADRLIRESLARGAPDNIAVVLVRWAVVEPG